MKEVIAVKDLCYGYPGQPEDAVHDVTFTIKSGEFVGVIGPNGSGKTTLLKLILHLLKPDQGSIMLFGIPADSFKNWERVGYVPQNLTSFDSNFPANVFEIVRMGLAAKRGLFHHHSHEDAQFVEHALDLVGMKDHASKRLSQLSGGQQQRVLIARALAANPEILILDEPTAEVDIHAQREFYGLLKRLNEKLKITIILISHDIGLVTKMAGKIICLNKSMLCFGPPHETLKKIERLFTEQHVIKHSHYD
jgi:zinc transport system ATP-binding protein